MVPRRDTRPLAVIKLGGSALEPDGAIDALKRLVEYESAKSRLVIVHGGSPEISFLYELAGLPSRFVDGLRVTTTSGADLVAAALQGLVAPRVLRALGEIGVRAASLSGLDAETLRAPFQDAERYGNVGGSPVVETSLIDGMLSAGVTPVISPVALGPDRETLNVNGDVAAAAVARAIRADRLDLVTTGPLRDGESRPIRMLPASQIASLIASGVATDGMIPKLSAAKFAMDPDGQNPPVPEVRLGGFDDFSKNRSTRLSDDSDPVLELRESA